MMKQVFLALALIAYVECAKLNNLSYLPPDNRPKNTANYDQGLATPNVQGSTQEQPSIGHFGMTPGAAQPAFGGNYLEPTSGSHQGPAGSQYSGQAPQGHSGAPGGSAPSSGPQYSNQPQQSYSKSGPSAGGSQQGSSTGQQIPILKLDTQNDGAGNYHTEYETGNGIQSVETGENKGAGEVIQGSFSYTSPEGEKIGLSYTADEEGFHPQGDNLPTPPPVPEAILKSIEYNKAHPEEEGDDGSYNEDAESKQYLAPKNNGYSGGQSGGFPSSGGHGTFGTSSGGCSGFGAGCSKSGGDQSSQSYGPSFQGATQPSSFYGPSSGAFEPSSRGPGANQPSQFYRPSLQGPNQSASGAIRPTSQGTASSQPTNSYTPPSETFSSSSQVGSTSYPCKSGGPSCGAFGPSSQTLVANQPSQLYQPSSQGPNQPGSGASGSSSQGADSSYPCKSGEPSCGAFGPSSQGSAISQPSQSYGPSSNPFGPISKHNAFGPSTQENRPNQPSQAYGASGSASHGTSSNQPSQPYGPSSGFEPSSYTPGTNQQSFACAGSASGCRPSYGQSKPGTFGPSPQGSQSYKPSSGASPSQTSQSYGAFEHPGAGPSSSAPGPSHSSSSGPQASIPSVSRPSPQATGPSQPAQPYGSTSGTFGLSSQGAGPSSSAFSPSSHTPGASQPSQPLNGGCTGFSGCINGDQPSPSKFDTFGSSSQTSSPKLSQSYGPSSGASGPSRGSSSPTQGGFSGQTPGSFPSQPSSIAYSGAQAVSGESGYQYKSPTAQFGTSSGPQSPSSALGKGEFGPSFDGSRVRPSGAPAVQAQDENGGYLY
ncbi:spidroin-2-like [Euwallacea similis]|uniref:spidroin-2-like n=1 Tax=Euwallacea similis TaxID=1736056 RepID=UPI00344CD34D